MTPPTSPHRPSPHGRRGGRRAVLAVVVAATLGAGALSGCSPSASTGVKAGSTTVSTQTIDTAIEHCEPLAQARDLTPRQVIVSTEARGALGDEILRRTGRTLSDRQRDQIIARNGMEALTQDPVCHEMARRLASIFHVIESDSKDRAAAEIEDVKLEVNPVYGVWLPQQLAVAGSSSLSRLWEPTRQ